MTLKGENGTTTFPGQIVKSSWFCLLSKRFRFFFSGFTISFRLGLSTMSQRYAARTRDAGLPGCDAHSKRTVNHRAML